MTIGVLAEYSAKGERRIHSNTQMWVHTPTIASPVPARLSPAKQTDRWNHFHKSASTIQTIVTIELYCVKSSTLANVRSLLLLKLGIRIGFIKMNSREKYSRTFHSVTFTPRFSKPCLRTLTYLFLTPDMGHCLIAPPQS